MKFARELEKHRFRNGPYRSDIGENHGAFLIPGPCGRDLLVIADSGNSAIGVDWEHVSVSAKKHCPTWREMCFIKDLFFDPEETVMQLHPPKSKWISNHPTCLHLWRPTKESIPLPPDFTVGDARVGEIKTRKELEEIERAAREKIEGLGE